MKYTLNLLVICATKKMMIKSVFSLRCIVIGTSVQSRNDVIAVLSRLSSLYYILLFYISLYNIMLYHFILNNIISYFNICYILFYPMIFSSILFYHIMFINKSSHTGEVQLVSLHYFYSYIYFVCSLLFSVLGDSSTALYVLKLGLY